MLIVIVSLMVIAVFGFKNHYHYRHYKHYGLKYNAKTVDRGDSSSSNDKRKKLKSLLISSKSSKRSSSSSSSKLQYSDDYYRNLLKDSGFNLDDITNNVNDNNLDDVDDDDNEDLDERARIEAKLINDSNEIHSLICDNNDNSIKLYDDGVIRIDNILSSNKCKDLLSFITKELEIAIKDVETGILTPYCYYYYYS